MKALAASLLLGLACFALFSGLAHIPAPEELVWGAWLVATALAAYAVGRRWPATPWRGGIVIAALQPICYYCNAVYSGVLDNPSGSSTGGAVAVGIVTTLQIAWSPIPVLLGRVGARAASGHPAEPSGERRAPGSHIGG